MGIKFDAAACGGSEVMPGWVPPGALHYIAHTEQGQPIRALAREAGCHASTVLRQIRKVEMRRDDPLVDAALRRLAIVGAARVKAMSSAKRAQSAAKAESAMPDDATLTREAMRVLRRLAETGAVLAVAADMDKAVVVRDLPGQQSARTAVLESSVAEAMALKDWITPTNTGRIVRYRITAVGRQALMDLLQKFDMTIASESDGREDDAEADAANRARYGLGESPIAALGRRRDKSGQPFLTDTLVQAGERLREDFELAQMDDTTTPNWDEFVASDPKPGTSQAVTTLSASGRASARVQEALSNLGPGLSDVALRCCCYLEGLETTEKHLGWSARSGKVVLRIALLRLKRHYDETVGPGGALIG